MSCNAKNINFSCKGCDEAYCVDCSNAEMSRLYCSAKCEQNAAEGQAIAHEDRFGYYPRNVGGAA